MQNLERDDYIPTFGEDVDPFKNCAVEDWSDKVKRLRESYIKEDIDTMIRFLKKVHPELEDVDKHSKYGNIGIEIRIIDREFKDKKGAVVRKSMVLYDFSDKSIRMFKNWYNKNVKNNAVCMYYSVSNFFSNAKNWAEDGKQYTKGRINAQNACFSSSVVLDFDNISVNENEKVDKKLNNLGLKFDSIKTSYNGWQKIFYLKEPCWDKDVIPKFTKLFLSRGFEVDEAVNNKAQVARILGSVNNKCFSGKCEDRLEQFKVIREKRTNIRIDVMELWKSIYDLPVVNKHINVVELDINKPLTKEELNDKVTAEFNKKYGDILNSNWIRVLPLAIKKMYLDDRNEGYTNDFLMFIVAHIKNTMKLSREDFIILMGRWADLTGYDEREKYIYIWDKYGHKDKDGIPFAHGKYTKKLAERYGAIEFNKVKQDYVKVKDFTETYTLEICKENIVLNNKVTKNDVFKEISDGGMKVFLCIAIQKVLTNKYYVVASEIIGHRLLDIKERQTKGYLSELVKKGYLFLETNFKGDGEQKYFIKDEYCILTDTKNLIFNVHEAQRMLEQLKANEVKFYILLKSLATSGEVKEFGNNGLATMLGISKSSVIRLKKSLVAKGFIGVDNATNGSYGIPTKYLVF
ncbi:hypothetical protein ACSXCO_15040 (plasmid) [Clostridium perfringens]|nr:hypothetical protein [Clostridium perfringens]HAT4293222.1 hypothetical protein [Clostridium perfringens]